MKAALIVEDGAKAGRVALRLPTSLGRSDRAKIRVRAALVSRRHCELFEEDGKLMIRDLNSSNGTYVNGDRIVDPIQLSNDDEIRIGPIKLRVVISSDSSFVPANHGSPGIAIETPDGENANSAAEFDDHEIDDHEIIVDKDRLRDRKSSPANDVQPKRGQPKRGQSKREPSNEANSVASKFDADSGLFDDLLDDDEDLLDDVLDDIPDEPSNLRPTVGTNKIDDVNVRAKDDAKTKIPPSKKNDAGRSLDSLTRDASTDNFGDRIDGESDGDSEDENLDFELEDAPNDLAALSLLNLELDTAESANDEPSAVEEIPNLIAGEPLADDDDLPINFLDGIGDQEDQGEVGESVLEELASDDPKVDSSDSALGDFFKNLE